jgi:hypothetical protein
MRGGLRSIVSSMGASSIIGSTTLGASTLAGVNKAAARAVCLPVTAVGDEMGSLINHHKKGYDTPDTRNDLHARFTLDDARSSSSRNRLSQFCVGGRGRAHFALSGRALASIIDLERRILREC